MECYPDLIATGAELKDVAERLSQSEMIAFDTEFIRETTFYPVLEIIQVATDSESWLIDFQAFKREGRMEELAPLIQVFENPKILKILHAAQGDQECLFTGLGCLASPSLDTAIAAALTGHGDNIGLGNLLKSVMDIKIKKGHARTNWSARPLPSQLIQYAHADVMYLVETGRRLLSDLDELGRREWALEVSSRWEDKAQYESNPETIFENLARGGRVDPKGLPVLRELVHWREKRVRQVDRPRRWVADDGVLMDLARIRPKDIPHLSSFRGLNKGEIRTSGQDIIDCIQQGTKSDPVELERAARIAPPTPDESQAVELLKCFVGLLADENRVVNRFLLTTHQMVPLLRTRAQTVSELVADGLIDERAANLIGEELLSMVRGRRGLSIQGRKVHVVRTDKDAS